MIFELEILFWSLLVSGIWFGAITQMKRNKTDVEVKL